MLRNSIKQSQRVFSKAPQHYNPHAHSSILLASTSPIDKSVIQQGFRSFNTNSSKNHSKSSTHSKSSPRFPYNLQDVTSQIAQEDLPYYKQLIAFDECTAHNSSYDLSTGEIYGGVSNFWSAVHKIMPLYRDLIYTGELNEIRMTEMVSLLRNGLRIQRLELSKLKKNLDKDANNPLKEIHAFLTSSIREVSQNLLDESVKLNALGLTHLFKAYKDLGFTDEAVAIWEKGKEIESLYELFTSEAVLGSVFPFLVENGNFDYEEILSMYNKIRATKPASETIHRELQVGMIRASLFKGHTEHALGVFQTLTSDVYSSFTSKNIEPPINVKSYMTMAHLSFIGFCQDIDTADIFFKGAVNEEMPYLTPLQLNFIKKYISNTWSITKDFQKVKSIWLTTWSHYEKKGTSNSSVSSSLNDAFLAIFFEKYPTYSAESFQELRSLINDYNSIKSIDEPFVNVLLSKSTIWKKAEVFEAILQAADSYNFPKTNVFYRCAIKASGSIDLPSYRILSLFRQLLALNYKTGYKAIAHADWVALRDATVASQELYKFSNPNEKIDLYFKLWKLCSPCFLHLDSFKTYIHKDIKLNSSYSRVYQEMPNIDTSDIQVPEIQYFSRNKSIESYIGYAY